MIPPDIRLYTWVDVGDVLLRAQQKGEWGEEIVWARVYWDSLTIGVRPGTTDKAKSWLQDLFDPRFDAKQAVLSLESLADNARQLQVIFEETSEETLPLRFTPTLTRPVTLLPPFTWQHPTSFNQDYPPIVAFHSFKGGVGRTLHALALSQALTAGKRKGTRVLLIDADLDAPGLTWLLWSRLPNPSISFADFLALAHGEAGLETQSSIDLTVDRVRDIFLDGVYVLPAFRSMLQLRSLEVRPEHLTQGGRDPFVLTNLLANLGKALKVQAVIVDLRAGLSELSAGLLLDPRVYRVFVTTLSSQSIEGTIQLLTLLGELAPSKQPEEPVPAIILNQIPEEYFLGSLFTMSVEERLSETTSPFWEDAAPNGETGEERGEPGPLILSSQFDPRFIVLPRNWEEVVARLGQSDLLKDISTLVSWLPEITPKRTDTKVPSHVSIDVQSLKSYREQLDEFAQKSIYAETVTPQNFLNIPSLRHLASDFSTKVPVAVIVGAKGAGKTYTFLQIVSRSVWQQFVQDADALDNSVTAYICPILRSRNLNDSVRRIVQDTANQTATALALAEPMDFQNITDYLRDSLKEDLHEGQWLIRWLNVIAWGVGLENGHQDAGRRLVEYLRQRKQFVVAIVDGLEDLFQEFSSDNTQQIALRSLLQDVPDWLEQQPSRPVGLLAFIRQDMVINAVKQNPAQLMKRYEQYALKWSSEEALRLVAWTTNQTPMSSALSLENLYDVSKPDLVNALTILWGRKLGNERSNEARSADWVIAALSDLQGQIQARDVIRFLGNAAQGSESDTFWKDRVLVPSAIRIAVENCSTEKIKEIGAENQPLGEIFKKLSRLPDEAKRTPFRREQVDLTVEELQALEDNGCILRDKEEYYMPEIFRSGLGFKSKARGRARVLALLRRAQK